MKLYVQLHRDHIAISFLDKHGNFVVDYVGLSSLIVSIHEFGMPLPDKSRHEIFNSKSLNFLLCPPEQQAQIVIALYYRSKLKSIRIDNYEVGLIGVAVIRAGGEVLLVDLIDLQDRLHLADVKLIGHGVIENMQLHDRELEKNLVVLEDFERV